jgi:hypothetical protein
MHQQLIVPPAAPPRGVLAGAALLTGAADLPTLYEALDHVDLKGAAKLLLVGIAGMAMGKGRQALGEPSAANLATALRQRDELAARVVALEAEVARLRSAAARKAARTGGASRCRWTAAERDALAGLMEARKGQRPGHKLIAAELSARFKRTFTAKGVAAKARRLGLVELAAAGSRRRKA